MSANYQQANGVQAVFQPGFAGTNPQQVRQDIAQEGGFASNAFAQAPQAAFGGAQASQAAFGGGAQAVFQPGFAGTNPQQVRQDIAREGGFASNAFAQAPQAAFGGAQASQAAFGGGAQAVFQPGFAGTNPQQVRQDIAREGGFASNAFAQAPQAAFGGAQASQAAFGGGAQAVFQPGFAGTNPQQVRQDIAREGGFASNAFAQAPQAAFGGAQASQAAFGGGAQAVFQPGFAGTNPQQVRQDIAREGGFASNAFAQAPQAAFGGAQASRAAFGGGAQAVFQPGFAGTNPQQVRQDIAREGGFASNAFAQAPQAAFGGAQASQAAFGGGAQAVFQPGFAGTNPQQVRQQIAQEGGFASNAAQAANRAGQAAFGGAQAYQAGFIQ
ncbi:hypothetical protein LOK74_02220 [Brevibacillus humidisoli]|uniref:hypothetical protein n=1 Tax=Brevibacillus humidisoli TaxID=2895522 RepID=UPI001E376FA3|nr:hypothetical protein [Brevibacillus humidisoli]UFJ41375.1 hypothetical protein LOK74_02220 [Brevibacillus humidisoli]